MAQDEKAPRSGGIEQAPGFHLAQAQGSSSRHFAEIAAPLGLTQKQVFALWLVADHPGISQIDLGQRLQMDRATTMGVVNRLQARGLIRREKSSSDGRKQALYLDPAGEAAIAAARLAVRDHENWLASRFTAAELGILTDLLARLHQ